MNLKKSQAKVLVTGAGGFIGSHLTQLLVQQGYQVRALVKYNSRQNFGHLEQLDSKIKDEIEIVSGDIQDPFLAQEICKGRELIFHLAALIGIPYSYHAPMSYIDTNVKGTLNMLQGAKANGVQKFIHTSTSETYGSALYTPIDEKHPLQGQSPYSASKIGADKLVESYGCSFDLPVVTVRPFNAFGPRQSARAVIPTIISQILSGQKEIKLGSLTPRRDLTFVTDTVCGFVAIAQGETPSRGEVFNVGNGKSISMSELAHRIIELMKSDSIITCDDKRIRPGGSEVMELLSDSSKIKKTFGWEPKISLDQGLLETIAFIRENLHQYKPGLYTV
jgi:NAD dependent epimerase/dehydratase